MEENATTLMIRNMHIIISEIRRFLFKSSIHKDKQDIIRLKREIISPIVNQFFLLFGIIMSFLVRDNPNKYLYLISTFMIFLIFSILLNWKGILKFKELEKLISEEEAIGKKYDKFAQQAHKIEELLDKKQSKKGRSKTYLSQPPQAKKINRA